MRLLPLTLLLFACGSDKDGDSASTGTDPGTAAGTASGTTSTTGTPAGTTTGSTTTQTFPIPQGWQRVDLAGGALDASTDAAVAADGTIYVSWVASEDVWVARSGDGGNSWEAPVSVDGPGVLPMVSAGRQPYIHAGPDTIWVTFTSTDPALAVRLYSSDAATLAFVEQPVAIGNVDFVDYAKLATDSNGELWLTWLAYLGADIWPALAREGNGFATEDAGSLGTLPCECCRNDLFFTSSGTGILSFRNNDVPFRDIWSMRAPSGAANFQSNVQISSTGWQSFSCPMQGPRMAELGDGSLITAWTDPTTGPWRVWTATSADDGLSWSGDARAAESLGGEQRSPDIAAIDQSVWLTFEDGGGFTLMESTDGGNSFAERERLDSGATNIEEPQVEAGSGMALVVGANAAGEVVFQRLQ